MIKAFLIFTAIFSSVLAVAAPSPAPKVVTVHPDPTGKKDGTAVVQRALDKVARAGGGTVYLLPGRYRLSTLMIGANTHLKLAGGVEDARRGWTRETAARIMDPRRSAIIRWAGGGHYEIFLYNMRLPGRSRDGQSGITVSGGVFDCEGRYKTLAFIRGSNIRLENMAVKDIPNNHAFQITGCENVTVANCLFAGYSFGGCLTRETIQVEPTSLQAITGRNRPGPPVFFEPRESVPCRNVTITRCWFGPSEKLGPQLIAVGHHGRRWGCSGLYITDNVIIDPLYCGIRVANYTRVTITGNYFERHNRYPYVGREASAIWDWGRGLRRKTDAPPTIQHNRFRIEDTRRFPLRR